jgi:diguanylate cyclase (GGDEF)-like protein
MNLELGRTAVRAGDVLPLSALLTLARLGRDRPLPEVLQAVAAIVADTLRYETVVMNVYRPAHHDYRVELVHGDDVVREGLEGTVNDYAAFHRDLMTPKFERVPGAFFVPAGEASIDGLLTHDPDEWGPAPSGWRPGDALFVAMVAADGAPLGVLSVDEPASGRRPRNRELELLVAVAAHAATALERAQLNQEDERHQRALTALVGLGARLTDARDEPEIAERVCATAVTALGFPECTTYTRSDGRFCLAAEHGAEALGLPAELPACATRFLVEPPPGLEMLEPTPAALAREGITAAGRLVVVPLRQLDGSAVGALVLTRGDDDAGLTPRRRQELQLLAEETVSAMGFVARRNQLSHEATHDPLTGLRNRRELESVVERLAARSGGVAILLCDLDRFKAANDTYGHEAGDRVLAHFAAMLRAHAREGDVAFRYGGEEFCLVLPGTGLRQAMAVAERLRLATAEVLEPLVPGQTVSIGVTAGGGRDPRVANLLATADGALYAAKAAGRNTCRAA